MSVARLPVFGPFIAGLLFLKLMKYYTGFPRKPTSISITNVLPKGPFQGTMALLLLWAPFSSGRLWSMWLESEPWQPTSLAMLHFGGRASGGIESSQTQNSCMTLSAPLTQSKLIWSLAPLIEFCLPFLICFVKLSRKPTILLIFYISEALPIFCFAL